MTISEVLKEKPEASEVLHEFGMHCLGCAIAAGESIEEAIRRFKRECERNGIMQEIKKREFYKSPSVLKKEKLAEAKRKIRRKMMKDNNWSR